MDIVKIAELYNKGRDLASRDTTADRQIRLLVSDLLSDSGEEARMSIVKRKPKFRLSPSTMTSCRRMVWLSYNKIPYDRPSFIDGKTWMRFKLGSVTHAIAQAVIIVAADTEGYLAFSERLLSCAPVYGFLDLAVRDNRKAMAPFKTVGEIKTTNPSKFETYTEPHEAAAVQVASYIKYSGANYGSVLYINQATGDMKEFCSLDGDWYGKAEKKLLEIVEDIQTKTDSRTLPKADPSFWDCNKCRYIMQCAKHGGKDGREQTYKGPPLVHMGEGGSVLPGESDGA